MSTHAVLNAQRKEDCIIDQGWSRYTVDDHAIWKILYTRQQRALAGHVCREYLDGLEALGIDDGGIPDFQVVNRSLRERTGWEVVAVPGLIPSRPFFEMLANRQFPAGTFIRTREQLDYLEEPDIFHDVFGHVPLLSHPDYANYMAAYGRLGLEAIARKGVKFLARLNWYTIEFGLLRRPEGVRIYGAGIVSSFGEANYLVGDPSAHHVAFDLDRVARTGYYIDDFQATYFVIDDFRQLFEILEARDFADLFEAWRARPALTPFDIVASDDVLRRGSGAYCAGFPATKALK
ncbi:phenylalanine 4-monooxygenase [Alsobacter soli]|uniref:Phenylalanine-4-hydroxylase n=1 Tax=Alsobacter soli TaxID=2109933 RepID=A0A2T1HY43_9HYPH|nr:phenylalanine 4-monooxygenase [Alsobacter soli]PSC06617.1 phenylalanine 4-monooxygenase [Alsobacter soli]